MLEGVGMKYIISLLLLLGCTSFNKAKELFIKSQYPDKVIYASEKKAYYIILLDSNTILIKNLIDNNIVCRNDTIMDSLIEKLEQESKKFTDKHIVHPTKSTYEVIMLAVFLGSKITQEDILSHVKNKDKNVQ
jgi:hypothetical protein